MYLNVSDSTELALERRMYQVSFQMMQAQLDQMNARPNGYSNTKAPSGVQIGMDRQFPTINGKKVEGTMDKLLSNSTTNHPKATLHSENNYKKLPLPSLEQNLPQVACESTSKLTPRKSSKLTPVKRRKKLLAQSLLR